MHYVPYAILDDDGHYPPIGGKPMIAIMGSLASDETYSLHVVDAGTITKRGCLLLVGKQVDEYNDSGMDLPAIEYLLIDVPDDLLEEISQVGASIIDPDSDIRVEFQFDSEVSHANNL